MADAVNSVYSNIQCLIRVYDMSGDVVKPRKIWLEILSRSTSLYYPFRSYHKYKGRSLPTNSAFRTRSRRDQTEVSYSFLISSANATWNAYGSLWSVERKRSCNCVWRSAGLFKTRTNSSCFVGRHLTNIAICCQEYVMLGKVRSVETCLILKQLQISSRFHGQRNESCINLRTLTVANNSAYSITMIWVSKTAVQVFHCCGPELWG